MMKFAIKTGCAALVFAASLTAAAQAPATEPQAPAPQIPAPISFPAPNPKNFTAATPTPDEVNAFLKAIWGYDENRKWSVIAVLKTAAPGVSKVVVLVAENGQPGAPRTTVFYTTPDGKHAIADGIIDFGANPFAENRSILEARANGAAEGAASKDLEFVEFADLQCPHCKEAQDIMNNLLRDFPQAHIVFENFPLTEVHPFAYRAAAEGECVRKAKGDAAFFTYAQAVYAKQESLTPPLVDATLAGAVKAAGGDPAAAATCAETAAIKSDIDASIQLGKDVSVDQTPLLFVNGHGLPLNAVPYETLKKIIVFQGTLDGITVHVQPSLTTLK